MVSFAEVKRLKRLAAPLILLVLGYTLYASCDSSGTSNRDGYVYWPYEEKGPVGLEAFNSFDSLPRIRYGVNTVEFSSYDREGYNDSGFTGTEEFLYIDKDGAAVVVDIIGPGCIYNILLGWFNTIISEEAEREFIENLGNSISSA